MKKLKTCLLMLPLFIISATFSETMLNPTLQQQMFNEFIALSDSKQINNPQLVTQFIQKYNFECVSDQDTAAYFNFTFKNDEQECQVYAEQNEDDPSPAPIMMLGISQQKIVAMTYSDDALGPIENWQCISSTTRLPICINTTVNKELQQRWFNYWDALLQAAD